MSQAAEPASASRRSWWLAGLVAIVVILVIAVLGILLTGPSLFRPDPDELRRQAQIAAQAGDWEQAAVALEELQSTPAMTDTDRLLLGHVEMSRGQGDLALAAVAAIQPEGPEAAQAHALAGQVALRQRKIARAEELFLQALELDPDLIMPRRELIYIYGMQLRRPEIQEQFRELALRTTLTYDEVFLWCLARGTNWEAKEHTQLLRDFLAADPEDRSSRLALAGSLGDQGMLDEADKVLDWFPQDDPDALAARAKLALKEGDPTRIDELLSKGKEDHAELARLRGQVALSRRDTEAALRWYRLADKLEPDQRETLFGLGRALQLAGDREAAAPYLETAKKLDELSTLVSRASNRDARNDPQLLRDLSKACEELGRFPEAKAWLKVLISRDPLDRAAQVALFRLEAAAAANPGQNSPQPNSP